MHAALQDAAAEHELSADCPSKRRSTASACQMGGTVSWRLSQPGALVTMTWHSDSGQAAESCWRERLQGRASCWRELLLLRCLQRGRAMDIRESCNGAAGRMQFDEGSLRAWDPLDKK
jgi:hypothetical protein